MGKRSKRKRKSGLFDPLADEGQMDSKMAVVECQKNQKKTSKNRKKSSKLKLSKNRPKKIIKGLIRPAKLLVDQSKMATTTMTTAADYSTLMWQRVRISLSGLPPPQMGNPSWSSSVLQLISGAFAAAKMAPAAAAAEEAAFAPICVRQTSKEMSFYVETSFEAQVLRGLIDLGQIENVRLETSGSPPEMSLAGGLARDKIKRALVGRYDRALRVLDLRAFHRDPWLCQDLYAPLSKSTVMSALIDAVSDLPELFCRGLEGLDLRGNRLRYLDPLWSLAEVLLSQQLGGGPLGLGWIDLRDNLLEDMGQLEKLRLFRPASLMLLQGNLGLEKMFRARKEPYARAAKAALPCLTDMDDDGDLRDLLNGLPSSQGDQGLGDWEGLPATVMKMVVPGGGGEEVESIVLAFVDQYLKLFDSADRSSAGLAAAYHEEALLSVSTSYPPECAATSGGSSLAEFRRCSRNLMQVRKPAKRAQLLRKGKQAILDHLCQDFPFTQHHRDSLTLDVTLASPSLIAFTLTGVFAEGGHCVNVGPSISTGGGKNEVPLRHFCRVWHITPFGTGFVVVNEMIYVTIATRSQVKVCMI